MGGGNGNQPGVETLFICPDEHHFFVYGYIEDGQTGECSECGWPYEIMHDPDGDLAVYWERRRKPVLVVDAFYSIRPSIEASALRPDVLEPLKRYKSGGYFMALIGHTDMVARGYVDHGRAEKAVDEIASEHADVIDMIQTSYAHPESMIDNFRHTTMFSPPHVGMLAIIEQAMNFAGYIAHWSNSLIVSERIEACIMAERAQIPFQWSWEFFERDWPFGNEAQNVNEFYQIAVGDGRSPYCAYCRGEYDDFDVIPRRRDWETPLRVHGFQPDPEQWHECEDQDWIRAAVEEA